MKALTVLFHGDKCFLSKQVSSGNVVQNHRELLWPHEEAVERLTSKVPLILDRAIILAPLFIQPDAHNVTFGKLHWASMHDSATHLDLLHRNNHQCTNSRQSCW